MKKQIFLISLLLIMFATTVNFAYAQATPPEKGGRGFENGFNRNQNNQPAIMGEVKSINGNSITIESKGKPGPKNGGENASTTLYTVDGSSAKILKQGEESSLSEIVVGNMIVVNGTISGTSISATEIHIGESFNRDDIDIEGNGQPVIGGTIMSVNGNIVTVKTSKGDITYTVDISSAKIKKEGKDITANDIQTGDKVVIQGSINGNSVIASSVIDQTIPKESSNSNNSQQPFAKNGFMRRMFGGIGNFFQKLFGF